MKKYILSSRLSGAVSLASLTSLTSLVFLVFLVSVVSLVLLASCDDIIEAEKPSDILTREEVFGNVRTIETVVNGLYTENLLSNPLYYYMLPFYSGPLTDDAVHSSTSYDDLNNNTYSPANTYTAYFWRYAYQSAFYANDLIDNIPKATVIGDSLKRQYVGEARYFRAYSYFVLTAFYGDVPLVTSTKILETTLLPRESKDRVIALVIEDLQYAAEALADSDNPNTKVTRWAALALLARQYLYARDWANAAATASEVIANSGITLETNIDKVFLRSSAEVIFKTSSSGSWSSYVDRVYFSSLALNNSYLRLTTDFADSFEEGDLRKTHWLKTVSSLPHSNKYRRNSATATGEAEDFINLRLSEQYLIRAEALAQQGKTAEALADLDAIRQRAGLEPLAASDFPTTSDVLLAIERERRHELFVEEAHRWWDITRTGRADALLGNTDAFPNKRWEPYRALLPIPDAEMSKNKNLTQNDGYGRIND